MDHKICYVKKYLIHILLLLFILFSGCQTRNPGGISENIEYFPAPDSLGGWRTQTGREEILKMTGIDEAKLDQAFDFVRKTTKNGGLLVVRHGYLVYEKYFGKGQRGASPNLGSCGKSFTGIAAG